MGRLRGESRQFLTPGVLAVADRPSIREPWAVAATMPPSVYLLVSRHREDPSTFAD